MKMKCVNVISFHTVSQDYMCKELQRFFFIATSQHVDFTYCCVSIPFASV